MQHIKTKYIDEHVIFKFGKYPNGQNALQLVSEVGEPLCTASVALDDPQEEGEIYIKDWSENQGVLDALVSAGIVNKPHRLLPTGYAIAAVCRFNRSDLN